MHDSSTCIIRTSKNTESILEHAKNLWKNRETKKKIFQKRPRRFALICTNISMHEFIKQLRKSDNPECWTNHLPVNFYLVKFYINPHLQTQDKRKWKNFLSWKVKSVSSLHTINLCDWQNKELIRIQNRKKRLGRIYQTVDKNIQLQYIV